jgi:pSer/pThr/pTyr-binding forkhead associated (FHA) protein
MLRVSEIPSYKPPKLPKSAPRVSVSVIAGPGAGQTVELTRCVTLIGSRRGCKLLLKSSDVSGVHCAIINTGEHVFLRDLSSTTGTYHNNLKAQFEELEDDDRIRVGGWELRVKVSQYTLDTLSDLPHVNLEPEPAAFGVEVNGSGEYIKLARPVGLVGRRDDCDVVLRDKRVSRAHALLFTYLSQPVVYDLLSNNGVLLEGARVFFGTLHTGDHVSLGPKRIRVILPGVSRRKSPPIASSNTAHSIDLVAQSEPSGMGRSPSMDDTGEGTVVQLAEEEGDRIDIRMAELDGG